MTKREREIDTLVENIKSAKTQRELGAIESNIEYDFDEGDITYADKKFLLNLVDIREKELTPRTTLREKCLVFDRQFDELKRSAQRLFDETPDTEENRDLLEALDEIINFDFEDHIPEN